MRGRAILRIFLAVGVLALGSMGFAAYRALRVDDLPKALPDVGGGAQAGPPVVPALGDGPDLDLSAHRGRTVFLVVENQASMRAQEGRRLLRALNRWTFPKDVEGFVVGDAAGFGFLREKIAPMVDAWAREMRFPVYVDFEGKVVDHFGLPRGHSAIVVIGPEGDVRLRHAGPAGDEVLEKVRSLLRASEPPEPPPAPEFEVAGVTRESCMGRRCVLAFVGVPVERRQVPFVEGGADLRSMGEGAMTYMQRPEIRLVTTLVRLPLPEDATAVLVGPVRGLDDELATWKRVEDAPHARAAFGVAPGATALFVVDERGRLALAETGDFPAYRIGRLEEVLGVELPRGPERP